jgi:hypothetical protein
MIHGGELAAVRADDRHVFADRFGVNWCSCSHRGVPPSEQAILPAKVFADVVPRYHENKKIEKLRPDMKRGTVLAT